MKKFFIILIATVTSYNCESDDICPESTLTTPRMIITFYDVNSPDERKNVESLGVYIVENSEFTLINEINGINTDSIAIPLRDDESVSNFKLCKDFSEDITVIPSGLPNHLYVDYETNEKFISSFLENIRNLTVRSYRVNEYVMYNILNYRPVPGKYDGCADLNEFGIQGSVPT